MKYYSNWQEALIDFTKQYGYHFEDVYNLGVEFEQQLQKNVHGTYFINWNHIKPRYY
jgi:hypothetical protein